MQFPFQDKFRGLKSAPHDSLTYALAISLCIVNHSYGGEVATIKKQPFYSAQDFEYDHS